MKYIYFSDRTATSQGIPKLVNMLDDIPEFRHTRAANPLERTVLGTDAAAIPESLGPILSKFIMPAGEVAAL